jgi:hypothetical protein
MKKETKLKAWAIMPSFLDTKEFEKLPFISENYQLKIYLTKEAAEKENQNMDEDVREINITFKYETKNIIH